MKKLSATSVLILGHQPLWLEALRSALAAIAGVRVSIALLGSEPDEADFNVVLVDPHLHGIINIESIERVRDRWPLARLVLLADSADEGDIRRAMTLGVFSYLLKTEPVANVKAGIEAACLGVAVFSAAVIEVISGRNGSSGLPLSLPQSSRKGLSPREAQVLQMIAGGCPDSEIGEALFISRSTVSRHVTGILNKLGCRTRSQAVAAVMGVESTVNGSTEWVA